MSLKVVMCRYLIARQNDNSNCNMNNNKSIYLLVYQGLHRLG